MIFDPAIDSIATLLAHLPVPWGFCGGWAIDLFLNRITRSHKDVDVAILRTDQRVVFEFLRQRGWTLEKAVQGTRIPFQEDEFLTLPVHTIWWQNARHHPDFLEVLLNESVEDQLLFRRDHSICYPLIEAVLLSSPGFPIFAPEIVLLYKSNDLERSENRWDFQHTLPALNTRRRRWLAEALRKLAPGHQWLKYLVER